MSLNICAHCTTKFSIGAEHCPQCGNADYYEEGAMAKTTRHGGPSYAPEESSATAVAGVAEGVAEQGAAEETPEEVADEALDAAVDEVFDLESDEPNGPYGAMLRADLQAECLARGLPTSGTKAELIARLTAADETDQADEAEESDEEDAEPA